MPTFTEQIDRKSYNYVCDFCGQEYDEWRDAMLCETGHKLDKLLENKK